MSDSGQGGQRSWWEKPDPEQASRDPYRAGDEESTRDAHDPYRRSEGAEAPTQAHPATPAPPTGSLPRYGEQQSPRPDQHSYDQQYGAPQQYGGSAYDQPHGDRQWANEQYAGQPYSQQYANQQYANQQYANQQYANQQYANQQYYGYEQPPVTGMAHAVLWTAVGGLVLSFTGLGWIASIVALALTPGARREILESHGTRRGLGFLLAGKICAWVNIGLTVLFVAFLVALLALGLGSGWDDPSTSWDTDSVSVLFTR
ncbi:DUF4190 domain-containing protein [Kineococcus sp. SYSU DK003]|uniref:DUF4190 domain-containing protein n=1 Tax=Kineococcus sp. SYSU DK003 TaxID=3383124 RepID=UPI003D7E915C